MGHSSEVFTVEWPKGCLNIWKCPKRCQWSADDHKKRMEEQIACCRLLQETWLHENMRCHCIRGLINLQWHTIQRTFTFCEHSTDKVYQVNINLHPTPLHSRVKICTKNDFSFIACTVQAAIKIYILHEREICNKYKIGVINLAVKRQSSP